MPIPYFYRFFLYAFIACISLGLTACSDEASPEEQIHGFIESARIAAEERSLNDFKILISDNFMGSKGYNKHSITRLAAGYFFKNKNIHLLTKIKSIYFSTPQQSEVQLYVAMAGQPIIDEASILDFRARIYKFDLVLTKEDEKWRLTNARWAPANSKNLFE